jgi:Integrase core domain
MRGSGSNVDGSWNTMVEHVYADGADSAFAVADAARYPPVLERHSASANQGKIERFHGSLQRTWARRGVQRHNRQAWLDAYRWEHNHVRPHEALDMRTPATLWYPSMRCYDPHPPRWEYPTGAWVLKVDCLGKARHPATKMEDQPIPGWRVGTGSEGGAAPDGVLLHHPHSRAGPRNPALENRRALDSRPSSSPPL